MITTTFTISYQSEDLKGKTRTLHFTPQNSRQDYFLSTLFEIIELQSKKYVYTAISHRQQSAQYFDVFVFERLYALGRKKEDWQVKTFHSNEVINLPFIDLSLYYNVWHILSDLLYSLFPAAFASVLYRMFYAILKSDL